MNNPMFAVRVWLEVTLAGLLYIASAFFLLQSLFGVHDLEVVSADVLPYFAVLLVGASYVVGLTLHSFIPSCFRALLPEEVIPWLRNGVPPDPRKDMTREDVQIALRATQELLGQMKGIYSGVVLFRLFTPGIFFLGFALASWCMDTPYQRYAPMILLISGSLSVLFLHLYREYFARYSKYRHSAVNALSRIRKHTSKRR
jgi:hypothetical protein